MAIGARVFLGKVEGKDFASGRKGKWKLWLQKEWEAWFIFDVESIYFLLAVRFIIFWCTGFLALEYICLKRWKTMELFQMILFWFSHMCILKVFWLIKTIKPLLWLWCEYKWNGIEQNRHFVVGSCIQPKIVVTIQINWFEGEGNVKTYPFRFSFPSFLLTAVVNFFPLLHESLEEFVWIL